MPNAEKNFEIISATNNFASTSSQTLKESGPRTATKDLPEREKTIPGKQSRSIWGDLKKASISQKAGLFIALALLLVLGFTPFIILSANLIVKIDKPERALPLFNLILTLQPDNVQSLEGRAEAYRAMKQYPAAIADLDQALHIKPDLATAHALKAYLLLCTKDNAADDMSPADVDLKAARRLDPTLAITYQKRAFEAMYAQDDAAEVIRLSSIAISIDPKLPKVYAYRATGYLRLGQYARAIADTTAGLQLHPSIASTRSLLFSRRAEAHFACDQFAAAFADGKNAIEADATARAYCNLGLHYMETGHYEEASDTFKEGLKKVDRSDMQLLQISRETFLASGDPRWDEIPTATGFIAVKMTEFFLDRADTYLEAQNYNHALTEVRHAIFFTPYKVTALQARGRVRIGLGQYDLALADFSQCIKLRPGLASSYYFRAQIEEKIGKTEEAKADRKRAQYFGWESPHGSYIHLLQDYLP